MLFQEYSGLDSDGVVGKTYQALNLSIDTKLMQVLVNLERLRWLNFNFGWIIYLIVLIYEAHMLSNNNILYNAKLL